MAYRQVGRDVVVYLRGRHLARIAWLTHFKKYKIVNDDVYNKSWRELVSRVQERANRGYYD